MKIHRRADARLLDDPVASRRAMTKRKDDPDWKTLAQFAGVE